MQVLLELIIFMKVISVICGLNDNVVILCGLEKIDWEVELVVVIGCMVKYVSFEDVMDYVVGYMIVNDVLECVFQIEYLGQWIKGKSVDIFGLIGFYFVIKDEVFDFQVFGIWLLLNGSKKQDGIMVMMVYQVVFFVYYFS